MTDNLHRVEDLTFGLSLLAAQTTDAQVLQGTVILGLRLTVTSLQVSGVSTPTYPTVTVQVSNDGKAWQTACTVTLPTDGSEVTAGAASQGPASYVRVLSGGGSTSAYAAGNAYIAVWTESA